MTRSKKLPNIQTASLLLRIGLALVFIYAAFASLKTPKEWLGFIPQFSTKFIAADLSLKLISLFQILLAVWLLSGKWLRYSAVVALLLLLGIVALNLNLLVVTFRDIGLIFAALALMYLDI
jgi:uncharacterized membrane protein YphA (DoxX/SURF4 family)